MRKFINKVTITGADDTVEPKQLIEVSTKYPYIEWGILFGNRFNHSRFPSTNWLFDLAGKVANKNINLSAHLCSKWMKEVLSGEFLFLDHPISNIFQRIQINVHGERYTYNPNDFLKSLDHPRLKYKQLIIQRDNVNEQLFNLAESHPTVNSCGLFDPSHGAGVLPDSWPTSSNYAGYAGGLSPDNVIENIEKIAKVARQNIWIDFETHARDDNDNFSIDKCIKFLDNCRDYIVEESC